MSVFPSGNHLVRFSVRAPEFADTSGVAGPGSDTGGEFTSSAATGHPDDRQEARTVVTVSPPASAAREQTANPEFATGVRTMTGHPGYVH